MGELGFGKTPTGVPQGPDPENILATERTLESLEERHGVEAELMRGVEGVVLDEAAFRKFVIENGFTSRLRGTYESESKGAFLYDKHGFVVETEEMLSITLEFLRYATKKGILFPSTKWGAYRAADGGFSIFAVTRKLDAWSPKRVERDGDQKLKTDFDRHNLRTLFAEDSHILEWYRRLDPEFDAEKGPADGSVLRLLNPWEASHRDNWAWDDSGRLYPIDIEVLRVNEPSDQNIINDWAFAR